MYTSLLQKLWNTFILLSIWVGGVTLCLILLAPILLIPFFGWMSLLLYPAIFVAGVIINGAYGLISGIARIWFAPTPRY